MTAPTNADDDDLAEPLKRAKTSIQRELESAVLDFCERHGLIDMVMGNWKLERHLSYPDLATERLTITIKLPDDWMDPDTERAETRTPRPTDPPV